MSPGHRVCGSSRVVAVVAGLVGLAGIAGCGGGDDAPSDAPVDAVFDAPIDTPAACTGTALTGEVVDWDATSAKFCGVFNATLTQRGATAVTDTTNPNGRFELCVARQAQTVIDVAFSASPSECAVPQDVYPVPGVFVAEQGVVESGVLLSARAMTAMRRATMFTQVGAAYSAAQAQLVVHVIGTTGAVTLAAAHATTQAFTGTTWQAGETGSDVFFANVAPGATQVTIGSKTVNVSLDAGVFTYLTIAAP
ncbi:MAG: hypothetical protein H7138_16710 [Myxococcales bacterium]|nr:hypothetical protein [Myxococcales bacterium]